MREVTRFCGMVSCAPEMRALFELIARVARTQSTVLIRGETGTGKELVARALHDLGPRKKQAFRVVNCATFTAELLASELFGHVRGAFTGAIRDRKGLFELAHEGTLFLDEIAEIPIGIQSRLLRVLQEQSFVPVGDVRSRRVDVRMVSATHQSLRAAVENRTFRADLMYRIRVVPIFIPPLRRRPMDVPILVEHFIAHFNRKLGAFRTISAVDPAAMEALMRYPWPGNVRELSNVVEYAFAIGEGDTLTPDDLTPELRGEAPSMPDSQPGLKAQERRRILEALEEAQGRKGVAAQTLGVSRSTLWRRMRELGLSV